MSCFVSLCKSLCASSLIRQRGGDYWNMLNKNYSWLTFRNYSVYISGWTGTKSFFFFSTFSHKVDMGKWLCNNIQKLSSCPQRVLAVGFRSAAGTPGISGQHGDMAAPRGDSQGPLLWQAVLVEKVGVHHSLFSKDPPAPAINFSSTCVHSLLANRTSLRKK